MGRPPKERSPLEPNKSQSAAALEEVARAAPGTIRTTIVERRLIQRGFKVANVTATLRDLEKRGRIRCMPRPTTHVPYEWYIAPEKDDSLPHVTKP